MKTKLLVVVLSAFLMAAGCGGGGGSSDGGGGGNGNGSDEVTKVEKTIDGSGGVLELSDGFRVEFPEGAVTSAVKVTVEKLTTMPSPLPTDITAASSVYSVTAGDVRLARPAVLTFPGAGAGSSTGEGEVGAYRYDGSQWEFVGGGLENGVVSVSVDRFSPFILGTGRALHFPVEFDNFWTGEPVIVKVYRYVLAHPDIDAPISDGNSTVVFDPPGNTPKARMYLPQGSYSFCFEWDEEDVIEDRLVRYYAFFGSLPSSPAVSLSENSSYVVPELVSLNYSTRYEGQCPVPQAYVAGEVPVSEATQADFIGTYNALDPTRTSAQWRAIMVFNDGGTFTFTEWLNGVQGTGSGTWSYDPGSQVFGFSVTGGASFSGPVVGSIYNFIINGTWAGGAAGQVQLYR